MPTLYGTWGDYSTIANPAHLQGMPSARHSDVLRARQTKGFRPETVIKLIDYIISGLRADLDVDLS